MGMSNQTEEKDLFHAVSLSGGKDSTAMLLLMVERGLPIHAVLTADTGMEFPEMYEHLQKLDDYLFTERGLHLTWLRHPKGFEWLMFEEKKQRPASIENRQRLGVSLYGNGWPGPRVRWCTGQLKTHLIHKEINRLKGQYSKASCPIRLYWERMQAAMSPVSTTHWKRSRSTWPTPGRNLPIPPSSLKMPAQR